MTARRVLVTGSRYWAYPGAMAMALRGQCWSPGDELVVVHGAARGADTLAAEWVAANAEIMEELGVKVTAEPHPADWTRYGKAAGPRRNAEMVALGADICLAFPLGESRGTRGCMALAEAAGIPVVNYGDDYTEEK